MSFCLRASPTDSHSILQTTPRTPTRNGWGSLYSSACIELALSPFSWGQPEGNPDIELPSVPVGISKENVFGAA